MLLDRELPLAADRVAAELLKQAEFYSPPVDTFTLAQRLGVAVVVDRRQGVRARQKRIAGQPAVFLRPEDRLERLQWAVAHEVGECYALPVFQELGVALGEITPPMREHAANTLAARLLMPTAWFTTDAEQFGYDLLALKSRYWTASHESLARRMLDLPIPTIISIFDQGRQRCRISNVGRRVPMLHPHERLCALDVHREGRPRTIRAANLVVQGWAIHEGNWKREILRTTLHPDADGLTDES